MIPLASKTNIQSPSLTYPRGQIKDDDGTGNGTPVNVDVYGDFHQFFEQLMLASGIAPNHRPDSEYDGYQLFQALQKLTLKKKVIPIGDWNMDSTTTVNVYHGLTLAEFKKIRGIDVIIRADNDADYRPINMADANGLGGSIQLIGPDYVNILRNASPASFDSTNYDSTGFNRGWVTITYEA